MARYPSSSYRRRKAQSRRRIYIISALVVIAAVVIFIYGPNPFGRDKDKAVEIPVYTSDEATPPTPEPESEPMSGLVGDVAEPVSEPNPKAAELIAEAMACVSAKPARIIEARDRLNEVLPMPMSRQQRAFAKEQLSELADKWLFSRTIFPQDGLCGSLQVKPGDQLRTIGKQFKVPYEVLMQINNIDRPQALQAGEIVKVINGPFHVRIYRSTFTMDLYLQNTFVRSFPVGLGRPGMETPMGLWQVKSDGKLISPTWTDPTTGKTYEAEDPDYPLGSRWIGLEGISGAAKDRVGFAIHGTRKPEEIGTAGSQGCIRLHNGDAILLYNLLMPGFSQVEIVE